MKWVRKIIAEECAKVISEFKSVEGKLAQDRNALVSSISVHVKDCTNFIEKEASKIFTEFEGKVRSDVAEVLAEKQKLIVELEEKLKSLEETLGKLSHWRADDSTVQTDKTLQKVK